MDSAFGPGSVCAFKTPPQQWCSKVLHQEWDPDLPYIDGSEIVQEDIPADADPLVEFESSLRKWAAVAYERGKKWLSHLVLLPHAMGRLANPKKAAVLMRAILYHLFSVDSLPMPSWAQSTKKWWRAESSGIDPQQWLWQGEIPAAEMNMRRMIQQSIEVCSHLFV